MGDRFEETIWEYKAQILDRDRNPKGPKVWVSKANSSIRVRDTDPAVQYEACEFGNSSLHSIAFRVTKTNGLMFTPNRGVLKPGEKVPLKFQLPTSMKSPTYAEIEVLAIRVKDADNTSKIEDKWLHVTSDKVSRARHTVELEEPGKIKETGRAASLMSDRASQTVAAGEPKEDKDLGEEVRRRTVAKKAADEAKPRVDTPVQESRVSRVISTAQRSYEKVHESRRLQITVFVLAVCLAYLLFWLYSLDRRVKNIEEYCSGIFWFLPYCHED